MRHSFSFARRPLALLLLATSAILTANAQIGKPRTQIAIGVNAGFSSNKVSFEPNIKQKQLGAPTFGFVFRYTTEKYFSTICALQAELNYSQLGWNEDITNRAGEPLPDTYKRKLSYLQLPLLARLGWGKEERGLQFYFLAGPQISYCFGETSEKSDTWTLNSEGKPDRPNDFSLQYDMDVKHKFDYGITAGIGLELNTTAGHFMVEGRYYYGLGDLFGNSKHDVFSRSANGTIYARVTYLFDIRK